MNGNSFVVSKWKQEKKSISSEVIKEAGNIDIKPNQSKFIVWIQLNLTTQIAGSYWKPIARIALVSQSLQLPATRFWLKKSSCLNHFLPSSLQLDTRRYQTLLIFGTFVPLFLLNKMVSMSSQYMNIKKNSVIIMQNFRIGMLQQR